MNKLIKSEFSRLFKSKLFYFCIFFMAGLGIFLDIVRYTEILEYREVLENMLGENMKEYNSPDGFLFLGGIYGIFAVSAFIGIFVGTDYSDGTIRNKLIVGHSRTEIYFSNLIVCSSASLMIHLAYILSTLILGNILLENTIIPLKDKIIFTAFSSLTMIAFSAICLLLSMLIKSKASSAVTIIIMTIIMFCATMTIGQILRAPEYYEPYSYLDQDTGEIVNVEGEKNLQYVSGTKREILEFCDEFLPSSQFYYISSLDKDGLDTKSLYSLIIIVITTTSGILIFKRKNLK